MMSASNNHAGNGHQRFGCSTFTSNKHRRLPFLHSHVLIDGTDSFLLPGNTVDENSIPVQQHHIINLAKARQQSTSGKYSNVLLLPPLSSDQQPSALPTPSAQNRPPSSGVAANAAIGSGRKALPQLKAFNKPEVEDLIYNGILSAC
jgi:hypothetical protein